MYQDILEESWVYQKILREGLEEGREQGIEEGLQALRQTLITFMETRFPALVPLAKQQIDAIKSSDVLQCILNKMFSMHTSEEAEQYLLTLGDGAKKN